MSCYKMRICLKQTGILLAETGISHVTYMSKTYTSHQKGGISLHQTSNIACDIQNMRFKYRDILYDKVRDVICMTISLTKHWISLTKHAISLYVTSLYPVTEFPWPGSVALRRFPGYIIRGILKSGPFSIKM